MIDVRTPAGKPAAMYRRRGRRFPIRTLLVIGCVASAAAPARAELWPTLGQYVARSTLIVHCRTEVWDGTYRYRVVEAWKGDYRPERFYHQPPTGYLYTGRWHGNEEVADGRDVVFFFTRGNTPEWAEGKLLDHSTSFPVVDGKLVYAATNFDMRQTFSLDQFRRAVWWYAAWHRAEPLSAAAGGWVYAAVPPPDPEPPTEGQRVGSLVEALVRHSTPKPHTAAPPPPDAAPWWAVGLLAGLAALGAYGIRR